MASGVQNTKNIRPVGGGAVEFLLPMSRLSPEAKIALAILGLLTVVRLGFCTTIDLVPDEAYYWLWSKHLAASYFSKGPLIGWTIALGTHALGDTVLGVRWIAVLLAAASGWQIFLLGRRLYSPRVGLWAMIATASVPLFALGSFLMTIDPLSVFFWLSAGNLFLNALEKDRLRPWIWPGLAVGLGFLAKYINLIELLGFVGYGLAVPRHRKAIFGRGGLVLLLVALACTLPVLVWNQQHGWITAEHLQHRGALDRGFHLHPAELAKFLTGQCLLLLPPFFLALCWSVGRVFRPGYRDEKKEAAAFLLALFLPTFLLYVAVSLNKAAQSNWAVTAYPSGLILATAWALNRRPSWTKGTIGTAFVLLLLAEASLFLPLKNDPAHRLRGWQNLGAWVGEMEQKSGAGYLVGSNYGLAGEIAFYTPGHPRTYMPRADFNENQFSFWPGYLEAEAEKAETPALYITDDLDAPLPANLRADFPKRTIVGEFNRTTKQGRFIDHYRAWKLER